MIKIESAGAKTTFKTMLLSIVLLLMWIFKDYYILETLTIIFTLLLIYKVVIFRRVERDTPEVINAIFSPADGKILKMEKVDEDIFIHGSAFKLTIETTLFHNGVRRWPFSGKVEYTDIKELPKSRFSRGIKFISTIGLRNGNHRFLLNDIPFKFGEKLIFDEMDESTVLVGNRFGLTPYCSKIELFLPDNFEPEIVEGDKVEGGMTVLGKLKL